jgi:hypothetical protein
MKNLFVTALILFPLFTNANPDWDVNTVLEKLKSKDAKEFVKSLTPENDLEMTTYGSLLDKIETGTPQWLEVAILLKPYTDAGLSEALAITLAQAIKNNPSNLLSVLSEEEIKWSCSAPLIEPTKEEHENFIKLTLAAVSTVKESELSNKKQLCIEALNKSSE